jgi:ComF family protein
MQVAEILKTGIKIVFPADCSVCRARPAVYPFPVCGKCKASIFTGKTPPYMSSRHVDRIWSCLAYNGAIKECIKKFKFSGQKQVIPLFRELTQHFLRKNELKDKVFDLIVPVPMYLTRRLSRGYNQSDLIAKILSDSLRVPFSTNKLIKTSNTHPQIGLSKNERINNLKGSFSVPRPSPVVGKSIILADDVITTGATLETCARELLHAGAGHIYAFTLARTL